MQRFGRAAIFQQSFANTPYGKSVFRMRLAHMTREIQRTLDLRGLYAIMSCKNQYMDIFSNLHDDYKAGGSLYALECFEREIASFAHFQKSERGLYALDEKMKNALHLNGTVPNSWLLLSQMVTHCTMEPAEVEYNRAGKQGRKNLINGQKDTKTFRGSNIYTVKDYNVYEHVVNPLKRLRIIGDFWAVRDFGHDNLMHTNFI